MRHDPIESYIFGNGGVESALGIVGVESRGGGTEVSTGDGAVLRVKSLESHFFVILHILGDRGVELATLHEETETGARSGSCTSCIGSTERTENLL